MGATADQVARGLIALIGTGALALTQAQPAAADGQVTPAGRWYTHGGNAARNGTSHNEPLLERPTIAWRQQVGGEIAGEPLVWGDRIVLDVRIDDKKHELQVRDLTTGALAMRRTIKTTTALDPSLWANEVVVRNSPRLELLRIGKKAITVGARMRKVREVGPPLRFGNAVFAFVDGQLARLRAPDLRIQWRSTGEAIAGTLSLLGDTVFAAHSRSATSFVISAHDSRTGDVTHETVPIELNEDSELDVELIAGPGQLFARLGTGSLVRGYLGVNSVLCGLPLAARAPQPRQLMVTPALDARLLVMATGAGNDPQLVMHRDGQEDGILLATSAQQPRLVAVPPTICGEVIYFGPCAVDATELRVLWRHDDLPNRRVVPAGRHLLLADSSELIALVGHVVDDQVTPALQAIRHQSKIDDLRALVDEALSANDPALAERLLRRYRALGADESWATRSGKDIARKLKRPGKRNLGRAAAVQERVDALGKRAIDAVWQEVASLTEGESVAATRTALRYLLGLQGDHALAQQTVRRMLPPGTPVAEPFDALNWLDFLDATEQTRVAFLEASETDLANPTAEKMKLLNLRRVWRQDLSALQSDRLLIFSPVDAPGSLARALSTGELVCDLLESMFRTLPQLRTDPRPMHVLIYASKKEYLTETRKSKLRVAPVFTSGHYSPRESLSRMFVPNDDAGFRRVLHVLTHELGHQWLEDRCPAYLAIHLAKRQHGQPGHWIVEGFASFLEQFELDLVTRTFRLGNSNLRDIEIVTNAKPGQLHDWDWLVQTSAQAFAKISPLPSNRLEIPSRTRLGRYYRVSPKQLYYDQAATLCRYLYEAEDGKRRRQLLDYVIAYYTGNQDGLDFAPAFGAPAAELGKLAVAHGKEIERRQ